MMESLRILLSAVFLSAVFLGAYYYVNTPADERNESISSLLGTGNSDSAEEGTPLPADMTDAAPIPSSDYAGNTVQNNPPFAQNPVNSSLPVLPTIESADLQSATVAGPYGSSVNTPAIPPVSESPVVLLPTDIPANSPADTANLMPGSIESAQAPQGGPIPNALNTPASPAPDTNNANRPVIAQFLQEAQAKIERNEILPTLIKLSQYYNDPRFTPEEQKAVHIMLMHLAGEVIYLHPEKYFNPYIVQPGDTIVGIAQKHQLPWQFLAKINGLNAPYQLQPGASLKVVRGPFNAEIHLDKYELTLWLPLGADPQSSVYAGTFLIGIGTDCPRMLGDYIIDEKAINPEYKNASTTYGPNDPNNPYGNRLLSLACVNDPNHSKIGIHGTNYPEYKYHSVPYGFICLGARDINDLYDILSIGSRVKIER